MKAYEVKSGGDWLRVKGRINAKGWLEWSTNKGEVGISAPGKFRSLQHKKAAWTVTELLMIISMLCFVAGMVLAGAVLAHVCGLFK